MGTQTIDKDTLNAIMELSDTAKEKLRNYVSFLRYEEWLEEQEDAEDLADIEARRNEPTIPFEAIVAKHEAKNGPLD